MRLDTDNHRTPLANAVDLEPWIPADHPLRPLKRRINETLKSVAPLLACSLSGATPDAIAPEVLLKSRVLMGIFSVRNDRLFCEQLPYNVLWLWFLDRNLHDEAFDPDEFTQCSDRLLSTAPAQLFLFQANELTFAEHVEFGSAQSAATSLIA